MAVGVNKTLIKLDKRLKHDFKNSNFATYVSIMDFFCDTNGCAVYLGSDKKTGITSWDEGHLTPKASYALAKNVIAKIVIGSYTK